jgi:hypothetical protein
MCTVSIVPVGDKIIITSNRDEKTTRKNAVFPGLSVYNGYKLLYPKDGDAGGTWIVMKANGDAAVLLNGAFICHAAEPPYRMSRGIILLDIVASERPSFTFTKINLLDIEPFTLVLLENNSLFEFRWDGTEKYCRQLTVNQPHIWSSATLYDGFAIRKREQWFATFLNNHPVPTQLDILNFHRFTGDSDQHNDLLLSNGGLHTTVSITSILLTKDKGNMMYIDLKNEKTAGINIALIRSSQATE